MKYTTFDLEAGTTQFYVDVDYYDHEFKNRTQDVAWYASKYVQESGPVLEVAVGSGRIALKAVREGAHVVGIDLSKGMIEQAEKHRDSLPDPCRSKLELSVADMRDFDLGRTFDLITCPFNAFMHMYTTEDAERCLRAMRAHLAPGGVMIMDILTPDFEYLSRSPYKRFPGIRFKHPTHGGFYRYSEQSAYDPISQLNQMWLHYEREDPQCDGPESFCIQLSHRYFFPQEMRALLEHNGFRIDALFGDFEDDPLTPDAESMVWVCSGA